MTAETLSAETLDAIEARLSDAPDHISIPFGVRALRALVNMARHSIATPQLLALGDAAVKWANHTECHGTAYDDREAFLKAARAYAASVAEVKHE